MTKRLPTWPPLPLLLAFTTSLYAFGQPAPATRAETPAATALAPFGVQGFRYRQLTVTEPAPATPAPPAASPTTPSTPAAQPPAPPSLPPVTHLNECEEAACGPGSKVAYRVLAPGPHALAAFSAERAQFEALVRAQLPAATDFIFEPPAMSQRGPLTIYEARGYGRLSDGTSEMIVSRRLHTAAARIDLVSASPFPKAAEGNADVFQSMLVIWLLLQEARQNPRQP